MNLTILLIAAYLPLLPLLFISIRSGAFGKGSRGIFFKLFFLGVLAAVPSILMEAGGMMAVTLVMRMLFPEAAGGGFLLVFTLLRYVLIVALIEEAWKHFVLRTSTWKQMTISSAADGTAAAAVVGAGFATVMYIAWQLGFRLIPSDMESLRLGMPDFLRADAVPAFLHALLYIPAHFGFAGFMGVLYGLAKGADQKEHPARAGFMLSISYILPAAVHGLCAWMVGYGIASGTILWFALGLVLEFVLMAIAVIVLLGSRDAALQGDVADAEEVVGEGEAAETAEVIDVEGSFTDDTGSGDSPAAEYSLPYDGDMDVSGADGSVPAGDGQSESVSGGAEEGMDSEGVFPEDVSSEGTSSEGTSSEGTFSGGMSSEDMSSEDTGSPGFGSYGSPESAFKEGTDFKYDEKPEDLSYDSSEPASGLTGADADNAGAEETSAQQSEDGSSAGTDPAPEGQSEDISGDSSEKKMDGKIREALRWGWKKE